MVQLHIHVEKSKNDAYLMSHTKIKSRWIIYLNEDKTIKLTEDNKGEDTHGVGREFLKRTRKALAIKGKIRIHRDKQLLRKAYS